MNTYFHGILRTDWGFGNPNKTAAFIATLMVGVWILSYIHKNGFWASLGMFTVLGICLIHTFSRGGIIAMFAGLITILAFHWEPWPKVRVVSVLLSIWIIIGYSIYLEAHERFGQGIAGEDRSITNRIEIWKKTPQMMVDAPHGWGLGNSGVAYMQWYQNPEHNESYRTLVNSHLTWLVELGWVWRGLYLTAWGLVLALCWPSQTRKWFAVPLGVWVAFAIAAFFSSIAETLLLWIVPGLCLVGVIGARIWKKENLNRWQFGIPVATALLILSGLFFLGRSDGVIHGSSKYVILGDTSAEVWMITDSKILGNKFGKSVRQWLANPKIKGLGIVQSLRDIPSFREKVVVVGATIAPDQQRILRENITSIKKLILINPQFFPEEVNISQSDMEKVDVIFGEFSQSPSINSWGEIKTLNRIDGAGDFLGNKTETILEKYL